MNNRDEVVRTYVGSSGNGHGFIYDNGTLTTLNVPGSSSADALAINNRGEVAPSEQPGPPLMLRRAMEPSLSCAWRRQQTDPTPIGGGSGGRSKAGYRLGAVLLKARAAPMSALSAMLPTR
jgi:hypothetical protein